MKILVQKNISAWFESEKPAINMYKFSHYLDYLFVVFKSDYQITCICPECNGEKKIEATEFHLVKEKVLPCSIK